MQDFFPKFLKKAKFPESIWISLIPGLRLASREFLSRYDKILKEDGTIEFKTDNRGLFDFSLEEVPEAGWKLEAHTFDLHHNEEMMVGNVMTEYEEKFSSIGNPICKMIIRR